MERAGTDHRYKFAKVTGIYTRGYRSQYWVTEEDYWRLQTAQEGDVVEFELNPN